MQNEIEHDSNKTMRGAYCSKHNLHYNSSRKGCVVCSREKTSKIILLIALVICLLLVIILVRPVLYPSVSVAPDESQPGTTSSTDKLSQLGGVLNVLSGEESRLAKLDPENYRTQIESIEKVLYKKTPANFGDIDAIGRHSAELGQAIMSSVSAGQRSMASRIVFWGAGIGSKMDSGSQNQDLVLVREEWEEIRVECFEDADWFK